MGHTHRVRRLSLSGQLLLWQMGIVVLVVFAVAGVSTAQTDSSLRRETERRMLSSAETLSGNQVVKHHLQHHDQPEAAKVEAEIRRSYADATYVIVMDARGQLSSATVPISGGLVLPVGAGKTLSGRVWTGTVKRYGRRTIEAHVPVLSVEREHLGERIGYVLVGRNYPSWWQILGTAAPSVLLYLLLAGVIGVAGSLLLARRVKRQTLGLEPREISALVEQREAMLHGVREGVLGVDLRGRISFANDEAIRLLDLVGSPVGRAVADVSPSPELSRILGSEDSLTDVVAVASHRILVLNSMPVQVRGHRTGAVISMRDRTELLDIQRQLADSQDHTDTLRAQVHEFQNRLHVIAGMVELGERAELLDFVGALSHALDKRVDRIAQQIHDPAVAALLVAKAVRADELTVELVLAEDAGLEAHSARLSADLVTVIGNLVDNAFDALGTSNGSVVIDIRDDGRSVTVEVADTGAGIESEAMRRVFEPGWTSKAGRSGREHGWGLALTRMACQRHGGDVTINSNGSTQLTAVLQIGDSVADHGAATDESAAVEHES